MKRFLRDYGLILVLIAIGVVGYTIFQQNKRQILSGSLDTIRARLVAMIDDDASRQTVARHFDQFEAKVLAREVAPDEVANVAANVLNLSNSGSTITPEQAALMLNVAASPPEAVLLPTPEPAADSAEAPPLAAAAPAATPPAAPRPPPPVAPVDLDALGERLESMLALDAEAWKAVAERHVEPEALAQHIRYRVDGGLHVELDEGMTDAMKQRLEREARRLAHTKKMVVVWKRNMPEEIRAERERARREWQSVAALRRKPPEAAQQAAASLESLESLKHLETLGYRALLNDSLRHEIEAQIEDALEALEDDLEAAADEQEEAVEEQLGALEDFLDEVLDVSESDDAQQDEEHSIEGLIH